MDTYDEILRALGRIEGDIRSIETETLLQSELFAPATSLFRNLCGLRRTRLLRIK